jgi:hypothetical protein
MTVLKVVVGRTAIDPIAICTTPNLTTVVHICSHANAFENKFSWDLVIS